MRAFSNKSAALAFVLGASAMTAACGGHGPNSYLMPKDAVMTKLTNAEKQYETIGGETRTIRATGWSGDTLNLRLTVNRGNGYPQVCEALVEAINEDWTRVSPSCTEHGNAMADTISEIHEKEVDEFVIAVLHNGEIDGTMVAKRSAAVAIDNMPDMQNEAIEADKAYRESQMQSGFAPDPEEYAGSDWGG